MNRLHHSTEFIKNADCADSPSLVDALTNVARRIKSNTQQRIDSSLAAVITVEEDTRYLADTLSSVMNQTVLPASVLLVNCAETSYKDLQRVNTALTAVLKQYPTRTFLMSSREKSFGDAVTHAVNQALDSGMITSSAEYMWLMHDDSRPLDDNYVDEMNEVRRNNALAAVIGAKQLSWDGEVLANVGYYAHPRHQITSLVVDGEVDQDQYDNRQDVYAVSLAGAFVRISDWMRVGGFTSAAGTFGQSRDFCRRIVRAGGRVIVEPKARMAHRRARFEGVRTQQGTVHKTDSADLRSFKNTALNQMIARDAFFYSDINVARWFYIWPLSLILAVIRGVVSFMKKQPYEALCELFMPWYNLVHCGAISSMRSALSSVQELTLAKLGSLVAQPESIRAYKDHISDLFSQRSHKIVSPLVRQHLRHLSRVRYTWLAVATVVVLIAHIIVNFASLRAVVQGAHLASPVLMSSASTTRQLFEAATTPYSFAGTVGMDAPSSPFLLVYAFISLFTFGHASLTSVVIVIASAPAALMSMWALAGIFTRSHSARIAISATWVAAGYMTGVFLTGNLPMMIVYVFLPAAVAFAAKALGVYQTEYPIESEPSIQASAWAALCFAMVCASEPQLFLAMVVIGIIVAIIYHHHVVMLVSMGIPSAVVLAPTIVAVIRQPHTFSQFFADVAHDNHTYESLLQLFTPSGDIPFAQIVSGAATVCIALSLVMAVVALCVPQLVKPSRSMWIGIVIGIGISVLVPQIAVGLAPNGLLYASMLPSASMVLMCVLTGLAMMSGPATTAFVPILEKDKRLLQEEEAAVLDPGMRGEKGVVARTAFGVSRACVVILCVILSAAWAISSSIYITTKPENANKIVASSRSLPIVAQEYLQGSPARRVLVVSPHSNHDLDYSVLSSAHGDIITSSAAGDVASLSTSTVAKKKQQAVEQSIAQLAENNDDAAITTLSDAGFGGMYVMYEGSETAFSSFVSHVAASNNTETVVNTDQGAYIRISIKSSAQQGVDMSGYVSAASSILRYMWVAALIIVSVIYLILGLPRLFARGGE